MQLMFPELRGGPVQGLNDAGVENFQGAIDTYLARECGQNTCDAPSHPDRTVSLEFTRTQVDATQIPAFDELAGVLGACREKWSGKKKESEFFHHAITSAEETTIPVLRIADFGTTGLTGDDTDDDGKWFALVKSQGVSNKEDTAGGSFGIGKSSPFAASRFRTVFYGTRTEAGAVALQGVSRLVTHKNSAGRLTQGTGFIGEYDQHGGEGNDPVFRAIRDEAKIPSLFRRTEPGTDIWVIGYTSGGDWETELIRSVLSNFWPAVLHGRIVFKVGETLISKDTVGQLIEAYSSHEEFEAHLFYHALQNQPIHGTLSHLGACDLYLTTSRQDLPRKICMVRNNGMRIYDYQPRACRVPFSGLFVCTDGDGNKLLRQLEPPRHDMWDAKRGEDGRGKAALDAIKLWIREEVRKLNPLLSGSSFNETELAKYLPENEPADDSDLPQADAGQSKEDDLDPKPAEEQTYVATVTARPISAKKGEGDGGRQPGGGRGGHGGGKGPGPGSGGGGDGGGKRDDVEKSASLQVRSFLVGAPNVYEVVLRSDMPYAGSVRFHAIGEDGAESAVVLLGAHCGDSTQERLDVLDGAVRNLTLSPEAGTRIRLSIEASAPRALTATVCK